MQSTNRNSKKFVTFCRVLAAAHGFFSCGLVKNAFHHRLILELTEGAMLKILDVEKSVDARCNGQYSIRFIYSTWIYDSSNHIFKFFTPVDRPCNCKFFHLLIGPYFTIFCEIFKLWGATGSEQVATAREAI